QATTTAPSSATQTVNGEAAYSTASVKPAATLITRSIYVVSDTISRLREGHHRRADGVLQQRRAEDEHHRDPAPEARADDGGRNLHEAREENPQPDDLAAIDAGEIGRQHRDRTAEAQRGEASIAEGPIAHARRERPRHRPEEHDRLTDSGAEP